MKTLIIAVLLLCTSGAYAMRCNGQLIHVGDSIRKVEQYCGMESRDRVGGILADTEVLTRKDAGMTETVDTTDGRVSDIEEQRE